MTQDLPDDETNLYRAITAVSSIAVLATYYVFNVAHVSYLLLCKRGLHMIHV